MPGSVSTSLKEADLYPRCARRGGNPHGSRPGSQAPHAPPALTFGLPGKQMVKRVQAGRDLIRLQKSLLQNRKCLAIEEIKRSRRGEAAAD
jgi:hypothetical protein